jgi:DNA-binding GntR family transcriptional regulator
MEARPGRRTLGEEAYDTLRQQILIGRLAPGSRLVVSVLANELQTSATPINEALAALEGERLVSYKPRRGYSVSTVTPDMKDEIYTVRAAVEALAVRLAAQKAEPETVAQLADIIARARIAVERHDTAVFGELDLAFHRAIWQGSASPLIVRIAELVEGQIRLLVATGARAPGRMPIALAEHERIYKAILRRKPADAEAAMLSHIRKSQETLLRAVPIGEEPAARSGQPAEIAGRGSRAIARKRNVARVTIKQRPDPPATFRAAKAVS